MWGREAQTGNTNAFVPTGKQKAVGIGAGILFGPLGSIIARSMQKHAWNKAHPNGVSPSAPVAVWQAPNGYDANGAPLAVAPVGPVNSNLAQGLSAYGASAASGVGQGYNLPQGQTATPQPDVNQAAGSHDGSSSGHGQPQAMAPVSVMTPDAIRKAENARYADLATAIAIARYQEDIAAGMDRGNQRQL